MKLSLETESGVVKQWYCGYIVGDVLLGAVHLTKIIDKDGEGTLYLIGEDDEIVEEEENVDIERVKIALDNLLAQ